MSIDTVAEVQEQDEEETRTEAHGSSKQPDVT